MTSLWEMSWRTDPQVRPLADRHYNRQKIGAPNFAPPGRCLVLKRPEAFWITSWPYAQYVRHRWAGAWVCSAFRNEQSSGQVLASDLIRSAVSATRAYYGDPPPLGLITFVNRTHVRPTRVRGKDVWGWTYRKAGFEPDGETEGGLICLRLAPDRMPEALPPVGLISPHKHFRPEGSLHRDLVIFNEFASL